MHTKNINVLLLIGNIFLISCTQQAVHYQKITVDQQLLDSIRINSDTVYSKPYKRNDFVTAAYFISKKDSTVSQVMRDSIGTIRQIVIEKGKRRIYLAQFFANGQLVNKTKLDDYGQYDGPAIEYDSSGSRKRSGIYQHGLHVGKWKNYDAKGIYVSTDEYNANGQQEKNYKEQKK